MDLKRLKPRIGLACFVMVFGSVAVSAKDKWTSLTTKNFNVVSNADVDPTRKLALKLEQFHYAFSRIFNLPLERPIKTTVIVFRSESSFDPYKPLYNGKPANVAGYFQGGEDENLIVVDLSANASQRRPMSVIYHEYSHLLTTNTPRDWPLWLKEGLAELYSSFDIYQGLPLLGLPIPRHVSALRQKAFIPLKDLLDVGHRSPLYNERDRQGIFYAESWALCHYMMIGDANAREKQMVEYTALINRGVASEDAFVQAFKASTAEIEKRLKSYISGNQYTANVYKLAALEGDAAIAVDPISEAEVQYHLGNLLARLGRIDEAEVLLKRATKIDPQLAGPYEGLGFVAVRRRSFDQALEYLKQAVTLGSKNHLTHYYYAETLLRQAIGSVRPPLSNQIGDALRTSIKLMPGFAFAHYALANLALLTDENLKEGLNAATTAARLEPRNKRFALALAQLQVKRQDYEAAKKTLEPLLSTDADSNLKESAVSIIESIERRTRAIAPAQSAPEPKPDSAPAAVAGSKKNPQPAAKASDSQPNQQPEQTPAQPAIYPTVKIEGAQMIHGVLGVIECGAGKWTLIVNANGKRMRFAVSNKAKLEFYSQDPRFEGSIRCGPVNKNAFIYFKPLAGQTRFAGDALAVEFTR